MVREPEGAGVDCGCSQCRGVYGRRGVSGIFRSRRMKPLGLRSGVDSGEGLAGFGMKRLSMRVSRSWRVWLRFRAHLHLNEKKSDTEGAAV